MSTSTTPPSLTHSTATHSRARADLIVVLLIVAVYLLLAVRFELAEQTLNLLSRYEHWQLDELPMTLLLLAVGMGWFSYRRWREQSDALAARQLAEAALQDTLQHNRKLAQQLIRVQEQERRHIARELHDEVGQCCVAMRVDAATIARETQGSSALAHASAASISAASSHLQTIVRQMLERIRPTGLDDLGLAASLTRLIDEMSRKHGFTATHQINIENIDTEEATNIAIYRAVQEALTNIAKHAKAAQVSVDLRSDETHDSPASLLMLRIEDDGVGMHRDQAVGHGYGLLGMRERVEALQGKLQLGRSALGGLKIDITLPMTARMSSRFDTHPIEERA